MSSSTVHLQLIFIPTCTHSLLKTNPASIDPNLRLAQTTMSSEEDFEDDYGPPDKLYDPLSSAAKEGSLDTLRSLVLEWRTKIFPAQIKPGDWRFQLQKAANKNQVCTLSYILSQGAVITKLTSILALDADAGRSYIKSSLTTAEISTPALTPARHFSRTYSTSLNF